MAHRSSDRFDAATYAELRKIARAQLRKERLNHTLQPTALVNETMVRLLRETGPQYSRDRFIRTAATVMRRILIDYARSRASIRRGGDQVFVPLWNAYSVFSTTALSYEQLLALDKSMSRLHKIDPRLALVAELRFVVGLTEIETAAALEIAPRTVKRDWEMARAWLRDQLGFDGSFVSAAAS